MKEDSTTAADMENLLLELQSYLSKVHPKRIFTVIPEIVSHLRSQSSQIQSLEAKLKIARGALENLEELSFADSKRAAEALHLLSV